MKPQMNRVQPRRNPANSLVLGLNLSLQAAQDPDRLKPELQTTTFVYGKAIDGTVAKKFRFRSLSIAQA